MTRFGRYVDSNGLGKNVQIIAHSQFKYKRTIVVEMLRIYVKSLSW